MIIHKLIVNYVYVFSAVLFCIGLYTVIIKTNLLKKLLGLNIMESAVFLFIVSTGAVRNSQPPILTGTTVKNTVFSNPLPQTLALVGIISALSCTVLAVTLIINLYERCGTVNSDKIKLKETEE